MLQLFIILLIGLLAPTCWPGKALSADSLAEDEAAVTAHIKALHNKSGEVRATAAKALRSIVAKYPSGTSNIGSDDGGRAYWMEKVNQVQPSMTKAKVEKILPPFPESPDRMAVGSGQSHIVRYRLDQNWVVVIQYRNPDKVIERPSLKQRALVINVNPPEDYTGTWTCWHVNGQKGHEVKYRKGEYHGTFTRFHDNGQKNYQQHYNNHTADGADTGWNPDVSLSYTGQYRDGKQAGQWTHWYPNGQKRSESHYQAGEWHGQYTNWYKNGQMSYKANYRDGVKHGEAAWNEQGVLQYRH